MKDAFGGILNLVFVVVFLLIVMGVLGLVVSYTKAFKMKNIIISTIEQYEGSHCIEDDGVSALDRYACLDKIKSEAEKLGFSPIGLNCPDDYTKSLGLYCIKKIQDDSSSNGGSYYRIITQVDIHFPIVSNIMGFEMFQVTGDTRIINQFDTGTTS